LTLKYKFTLVQYIGSFNIKSRPFDTKLPCSLFSVFLSKCPPTNSVVSDRQSILFGPG